MDAQRAITEIELLQRMYALPDRRPLQAADISAANQRHDHNLATSPWFKLWRDFGVCCRPEAPGVEHKIGE